MQAGVRVIWGSDHLVERLIDMAEDLPVLLPTHERWRPDRGSRRWCWVRPRPSMQKNNMINMSKMRITQKNSMINMSKMRITQKRTLRRARPPRPARSTSTSL